MKLYALSDLHLSFAQDKPMDIFGEIWRDHPAKIKERWLSTVEPSDTVLLGGDFSWAMRLEDLADEIAYLAELPGRKVMIKGNHDYWWASDNKVRRAFAEGVLILNGHAVDLGGGLGVAGTRLWCPPGSVESKDPEKDEKIYRREVARLERALEQLAALEVEKRMVMVHYPPTHRDKASEVEDLLHRYAIGDVIYGHLHGEEDHQVGIQGEVRGIRYHLTSADYLDFRPVCLGEF